MFKRTSSDAPAQAGAGTPYTDANAAEEGCSVPTGPKDETDCGDNISGLPSRHAHADKTANDRAWLAAIAFEEARDAEADALDGQFGPEDFDFDEHPDQGEQDGSEAPTSSPPNIAQEAVGATPSPYTAIRWPGRLASRRGS